MEYGVTTKNKFAFLGGGEDDDVSDPTDISGIIASAEPTEVPKAKEKMASKSSAAPAKKSTSAAVSAEKKSQPASRENKENDVQPAKTQTKGSGPTVPRGPRGPRTNYENKSKADESRDVIGDRFGETRPPPQNNRRGDGGNHGHELAADKRVGGPRQFRGGPRGPPGAGGGQGFNRRPRNENAQDGAPTGPLASDKDGSQQQNQQDGARSQNPNRPRIFNNRQRTDRNSGSNQTGVKSIPKREGGGKGNWGTNSDEVTGATEPTQTSEEESKKPEGAVGDEKDVDKSAEDVSAEKKEDEAAQKEEEEKVRLTLEEWKAQHKVEKPQFNVRKAGEGSDQKIYQNFVPIVKTASEEQTTPAGEEEDHVNKVKRTRQKQLEIEVSFAKGQRNVEHGAGMRGGRGDRGGFRPGDSSDYRNDRGGGSGGRGFHGERRGGGGGFSRGGGGGGSGPGGRRPYNDAGRPHAGPSSHSSQAGAAAFNLSAEAFPALGAQ